MKILIAYIPAFHKGYLNLIQDEKPDKIYLISEDFISVFENENPYLSRSFIHAVSSQDIQQILRNRFPFVSVDILNCDNVECILHELISSQKFVEIVLPQEDVSDYFVSTFCKDIQVSYSKSHFLRWNQHISKKQPIHECIGKKDILFDEIISKGYEESQRSFDWWRQVGAVLFDSQNHKIICTAYNKHLPYEGLPNVFGDARSPLTPGQNPEWVTAIHAEQHVLMKALREGHAVADLALYTTTYPCPVCAKLIALSGISQVFYTEGYSVMEEAGNIMTSYGVEIFQIH
jgi:dCMP deaminase